MSYLLDTNALLAWEHSNSPHHAEFHAWAGKLGSPELWTCAHTELGFLRVSMQVFGYSLAQAAEALGSLKRQARGFVGSAPSPRLPAWASTAGRTSDAYLTQLARENGLRLATFDSGIRDPAAHLIGRR